MSTMVWESGTPVSASFADAWSGLLQRCSSANFTMDLAFLDWEHAHGRRSRAILNLAGDGVAAVFRHTPGGWTSGWPWRWQVALDGGSGTRSEWPDPSALRQAIQSCARAGGLDHARVFLPLDAAEPCAAYLAGSTISRRLDLPEDELFQGMDRNKRRSVKQAQKAGYEIVEATTHAEFRAFAELQLATERRRGASPKPLPEAPAAGEGWREWELPWMWLLLARREGRIEAGSGFGRFSSGLLDYRTNASTPEGMKAGANALLAWEAMRRGSLAGYRRMNWGGNTTFKQELGGEHIPMMCQPAGGSLWSIPNALEVHWHRARLALGRRLKRARA